MLSKPHPMTLWRLGKRVLLSYAVNSQSERMLASAHILLGLPLTPPLAVTVPRAVMLQESDPKKQELSRLLNPEKYAHTAAIERLQPYDPGKPSCW
jgi:hypothetical protein